LGCRVSSRGFVLTFDLCFLFQEHQQPRTIILRRARRPTSRSGGYTFTWGHNVLYGILSIAYSPRGGRRALLGNTLREIWGITKILPLSRRARRPPSRLGGDTSFFNRLLSGNESVVRFSRSWVGDFLRHRTPYPKNTNNQELS